MSITFDDLEKELVFKQNLIIISDWCWYQQHQRRCYDSCLKFDALAANERFCHYVKTLF